MKMATLKQFNQHTEEDQKSSLKCRQILTDVYISDENALNCSSHNFVTEVPCEATKKDAFFTRVESYSCLKWTGKPCVLSPLICAQYGWINIDCDMLMCCSCQMFLCATIKPTLDLKKYKERILELKRQLKTQHKEFCSWPDFPCPDRFCTISITEPEELFNDFLKRFNSLCLFRHELPTIKSEQLKVMALTNDVISCLLQLIKNVNLTPEDQSDTLNIKMTACTLALCGWTASRDLNLKIFTCTYCTRNVGLWNFHQLESAAEESDNSSYSQTSIPIHEGGNGDKMTPTSISQSSASCRMKLRSQDPIHMEQFEGASSSMMVRTRSRDSPSPIEDIPRSKRPLTRSRGHGDDLEAEILFSSQRKTKRLRLSSSSGLDGLLHRNLFDPVGQHRHWCPWVNVITEPESLDDSASAGYPEPTKFGWRAALSLFLTMKQNLSPVEGN
ncbi:nuclear-interacting partner of ALK [Trichomycterus rosablanca]|uniref:nuclear-interacting partner of ALK n=1 Tax=Trichomycterus rosablanca TaxID=2290929 RepID=UPI002F35A5A6